jgi:hypothetical protein
MSVAATNEQSPAPGRPRRGWLILATIGCALVVIAMVVVGLVIADKERFGSLVGSMFLPVITSGVLVGAAMLLIALAGLPGRKSWRWWTLLLWAVIAMTSPLFGFLFLIPWSLLALTLPLVISVLVTMFRRAD